MISATTLMSLIMMLSSQGFWLSNHEYSAAVSWPVQEGMPPAKVAWELSFGRAVLDHGDGVIDAKSGRCELKIKAPAVRVPAEMKLLVTAVAAGSGEKLATVDQTVHVFPDELLPGVARRLKAKQMLVWDDAAGLPAVLAKAGVEFTRIADASAPIDGAVDLVLVGPDQLDDRAEIGPLLALARAGAQVLVLQQKRCGTLAGWPLVERRRSGIEGKWDHLVFEGLTAGQWRTAAEADDALLAIRAPRDAAVTPLAWWKSELADETEPTDLMVASVPMGKGRLVLCQMPLSDWENDPRARILLANLVDYLQTAPEPATRPSRATKHEQRQQK